MLGSGESIKIRLVWDNWGEDGTPMPNGLHPKYIKEWSTKWKHRYDINVLTRFIPLERYNRGFFPLLSAQAGIYVDNVKPEDIAEDMGCKDWYVMEPNHMDVSLLTENMFGNINEYTLDMIRRGAVKLVLYYAYEAFPVNQVNWINVIERSLGWLKIPPENFILIFGDQKFDKNYQNYLNTGQGPYYNFYMQNVFTFDHFAWEFSDYIKSQVVGREDEPKELVPATEETRDRLRPKKFLCLNGGGRPHRKFLMTEFARNDLFKHGIVSYLNKFDIPYIPEHFCFQPVQKGTGDQGLIDMLEFHKNYKIKEMNLDVDATQDAWHNRGMTAQHYLDTYFNVTTETWPAEPSFFVTEKIYKPIMNLQPFILLGHPGLLAYLKENGYETFPEFFDEHYDNIEDHAQRFYSVMQNIIRVNAMPQEELHGLYKRVWPKLLHNRQKLLDHSHAEYWRELIKTMKEIR